ncbi:MAG: metallophosphoesterase family protein [Anaerolineales bacterium]|nr:metallophosphoesterase family protein [Anaerolineales bacterium]
MKILAISDEVVDLLYSARLRQNFGHVDLVLGCGDLPFYYLEYIVTALDVPLYYVPGNHDRLEQYLSDGRIIHQAEGCEALDGRAVDAARQIGARLRSTGQAASGSPALLVAGLGGSMRYNAEGIHQYTEAEMWVRAARLAPSLLRNRLRYGRFLDILVTHAPPRGIHDDTDPAHIGFQVFRTLMDVFRPRLLLHGHAHVYRSDTVTRTRYKDTQVINVYPYRLIEWDGADHD